MIDRRLFVTAAVGTIVTAGMSMVAGATARPRRLRKLSVAWWNRRLNRRAQLQGDDWHLVEVDAVHDASSSKLDQFTLVFRGSVGDPVSEGIYDVKLGRSAVELFIQPAGSDAAGTYSRATICRFR